MPPAVGARRSFASSATAPQPTRQSSAAKASRSPVSGGTKSPVSLLPPPSSPSSRLVLGSRGRKRAAANGGREHADNGSNKRRTQRSSSSDSDNDSEGSGNGEEKDNSTTANKRNGESQLPRRYSVRAQPTPTPQTQTKENNTANTLYNYFSTASSSSSSSSSPPSLLSVSSQPASRSASRSTSPSAVPVDVAAVLGVVSPHEANIARQASAMKRISRLHAQLQSDMTWDPGKREGKDDKAEDDTDNDETDEHNSDEHNHTNTTTRPFTTPRRKGRPPPLNASLIQTPPFRLLSVNSVPRSAATTAPSTTKRAPAASTARRSTATSSSSAALSPTPFDLPATVFTRRHLPLTRAERRMRAEQRRESTENWITCDACSKWRLHQQQQQPSTGSTTSASHTPQHYYCGGGSTVEDSECERLDDWIVRCVGEGRAVQLSDVGVDTVEVLAQASGKRRREFERDMERLGMEFDTTTQKIKCFSVTRGR